MAPVRWSQGPFRITGLGGRNPVFYLFCGPKYIGRGASVEALQERASTLDPEEVVTKARPTPPPRASIQAASARRPPPRLMGTFTMREDDTPDTPETQEEDTVATSAKKKVAAKKKTATPKPKAVKPKAEANGRLDNECTFKVDLTSSPRRPQSKGFKHLQNLKANEGKTLGELRKREWFMRAKLNKDIEDGAVTVIKPKE